MEINEKCLSFLGILIFSKVCLKRQQYVIIQTCVDARVSKIKCFQYKSGISAYYDIYSNSKLTTIIDPQCFDVFIDAILASCISFYVVKNEIDELDRGVEQLVYSFYQPLYINFMQVSSTFNRYFFAYISLFTSQIKIK